MGLLFPFSFPWASYSRHSRKLYETRRVKCPGENKKFNDVVTEISISVLRRGGVELRSARISCIGIETNVRSARESKEEMDGVYKTKHDSESQ